MATDLTVLLDDQPGALAGLGEALGAAGVNLGGACAVTRGGRGEIHLLIEGDAAGAAAALRNAGYDVEADREMLVVDAEDRPGELGATARKLADAGVNIQVFYVGSNTRLVFGVDNLAAARTALGTG